MKVASRLLLLLGLFFAVMVTVYWNWGHENAGSVMMLAGALLCFLPGAYYFWWAKRMGHRPEDDPNATPQNSAEVVGAFPGTSIWPFTLGMGAFTIVLAMVFGIWLLIPGLALAVWAFLGATAEGRRGGQH